MSSLPPASVPYLPPLSRPPRPRLAAPWRWSLWSLMVALVVALLVTLVWLAGRYEASQVQSRLERDTADAVADIRNGLTRNIQTLQALHSAILSPANWQTESALLLRGQVRSGDDLDLKVDTGTIDLDRLLRSHHMLDRREIFPCEATMCHDNNPDQFTPPRTAVTLAP